jgi:hypothetical protein
VFEYIYQVAITPFDDGAVGFGKPMEWLPIQACIACPEPSRAGACSPSFSLFGFVCCQSTNHTGHIITIALANWTLLLQYPLRTKTLQQHAHYRGICGGRIAFVCMAAVFQQPGLLQAGAACLARACSLSKFGCVDCWATENCSTYVGNGVKAEG